MLLRGVTGREPSETHEEGEETSWASVVAFCVDMGRKADGKNQSGSVFLSDPRNTYTNASLTYEKGGLRPVYGRSAVGPSRCRR